MSALDRPTVMHIFDGLLHYSRTSGGDVTPLHGELSGALRLRVGDCRVLFALHGDVMRILSWAFGIARTCRKPEEKGN